MSVAVPGDLRLLLKYLVMDGYVELVRSGQRLFNPTVSPGTDWLEVERINSGVALKPTITG
jgi:hypothetical protein